MALLKDYAFGEILSRVPRPLRRGKLQCLIGLLPHGSDLRTAWGFETPIQAWVDPCRFLDIQPVICQCPVVAFGQAVKATTWHISTRATHYRSRSHGSSA
jgi:hypothetical protein